MRNQNFAEGYVYTRMLIKKDRKQRFIQKLAGAVTTALGLLSINYLGDATAALLLVPAGLYALLSSKNLFSKSM